MKPKYDKKKILGLNLASNNSFDSHLWEGNKNMIKSINTKIGLLKTVKPFISKEALANVGGALINSTILYGAPVWGNTTQTNLDRVQRAQTKAARFIDGRGWKRDKQKSHRQTLLNELKWPNVEQIVNSSIINLTKKAISNKSSQGINNLFATHTPPNPRKTKGQRIAHKGHILRNKNSFSGKATHLYNCLPENLKNSEITPKLFKTKLKEHMKTQHLLKEH